MPSHRPSSPANDELASNVFPHALGDIHFRMLVDAVQDYAIFMLDPDGRVASWNRGAQNIKGYAAQDIIGQHFSVFYTPDDVAAEKPRMELTLAASEGRAEDEGWRVRKDGSRFWANVTITAIRESDGTLRGFAKVTRDMTDRLRLVELQHASALSLHVQTAREEERSRIARELHDDLGQQLVALKMDVALLNQSVTEDGKSAHHTIKQTIALQAHIDSIIASARRIAGGLRPPCSTTWAWVRHSNGSRRNFAIATGLLSPYETRWRNWRYRRRLQPLFFASCKKR